MVSSFITCPFLVFALLCSQTSFGAIVHRSLDDLPTNDKYDFIVAGGQSAVFKCTKPCSDSNKVARAARYLHLGSQKIQTGKSC